MDGVVVAFIPVCRMPWKTTNMTISTKAKKNGGNTNQAISQMRTKGGWQPRGRVREACSNCMSYLTLTLSTIA